MPGGISNTANGDSTRDAAVTVSEDTAAAPQTRSITSTAIAYEETLFFTVGHPLHLPNHCTVYSKPCPTPQCPRALKVSLAIVCALLLRGRRRAASFGPIAGAVTSLPKLPRRD